ncbi:phosphoribosyltransferase family protein [Streptomyces tropicalis]|uniref:Phosphoribosyltransferase family protein n=1 Tax=Streptomyces tropicalis TaxID=3034234 RepID=A0ABT6A3A6_9ACTN|nr:phosphoribosyltransferase family protein [Streptomyces tropicalis]MDF3299117.1 phosphoribosyltransferase family protein [Streptomyces tropicalis]
MRFENRADAGRRLARRLEYLRGTRAVVLGVPRGGVPVAFELARCLDLPLDVIAVRKLRVPWQPELGFGAVGEHGVLTVDEDVLRESGLSDAERESVEQAERAELERRTVRCRAGLDPVPLDGATAVVVDDGLATGATVEAACRVARARGAGHVVLAVPVGPERALPRLDAVADEIVCLQALRHVGSLAAWYREFPRVTDEQVGTLLADADRSADADRRPSVESGPEPEREVEIPAGESVRLAARLTLPAAARAVVVLARGTGGGRQDPGDEHLAAELRRSGFGTLVLDLLTEDEAGNRHNAFDILLLARRLRAAADWLRSETALPVGYLGTGTGAAAALEAAAADDGVRAVVCRAGRPDLARPAALARVRAATLFVVGGLDIRLLSLNRLAAEWMRCDHRLTVVPGATHHFAEPGALAAVAELARDWFAGHLVGAYAAAGPLKPA